MGERLGRDAGGEFGKVVDGGEVGAVADGAVEDGGAEDVGEASIHAPALVDAQRAGVGVGQDGLRSVLGDGFAHLGGGGLDRFVPGDALERGMRPFGADALDRVEEAAPGSRRALGSG